MTPPLRENPASVLDPHAPQSVPENPQVFDDVIEQRVLRSLIHDLRSPMAVLGAFFDSDSRSDSQDIRDRARAAFEQSNRLLEEFIETVQTGLFEQPPLLEETNVAAFLVDVARLYSVAMRNALPAITLKIRSPSSRMCRATSPPDRRKARWRRSPLSAADSSIRSSRTGSWHWWHACRASIPTWTPFWVKRRANHLLSRPGRRSLRL